MAAVPPRVANLDIPMRQRARERYEAMPLQELAARVSARRGANVSGYMALCVVVYEQRLLEDTVPAGQKKGGRWPPF